MRTRSLAIALLALVMSACASLSRPAGRPAVTAGSTTTGARPATARSIPAVDVPPGIVDPARRRPAPALRVTTFDRGTVTLDEFRGRPAVVSFFESWCPICQAEQPELTKVAKQFAGQVGFVGVSNHDTVAAGRTYARRFQVPYPLANDASGTTWARWQVPYQPVVVLLDKRGRIAERFDGGTTGGTLRAALGYLVREAQG